MTPSVSYDDSVLHPTPLTGFQWAHRTDGQERYEATGTCPVCQCAITTRWPWGQLTVAKGGFLGRRSAPDTVGPWYSVCCCRSLHMGRPTEVASGCGAILPIALPPTGLPR